MSRSTFTALLVVTGACASATSTPPVSAPGAPASVTSTSTSVTVRLSEDQLRSIATIEAPIDTVWGRLPGVYQALGIAAEVNDARARTFGTKRFTQRRVAGKRTLDLVHCGHEGAGPSAVNARRLELSIMSSLRPLASGGTELTTEISGVGRAVDGTSTAAVRCVSTGELEHRIATMLSTRLVSPSRDAAEKEALHREGLL